MNLAIYVIGAMLLTLIGYWFMFSRMRIQADWEIEDVI